MAYIYLNNGKNSSIKLSPSTGYKVLRQTTMPSNYFQDLLDVQMSGISKDTPNTNKTNYVVVYDSVLNKFTLVDPDVVVSTAATTASVQPGLPADFINTLDTDLDDKVDLDGGTW